MTLRVVDSNCPDCKVAGKSAVELAYNDAAEALFGKASSGRTVRDKRFARRMTWTIDIGVIYNNKQIAIEYDGGYWHEGKVDIDTDKSLDLLSAGFGVVRLRKHTLPPLLIANPSYKEITDYSNAPQPEAVMQEIKEWCQNSLSN